MNDVSAAPPQAAEPCGQCGITNRAAASFCGGCGSLLGDSSLLERADIYQRPFVVSALAIGHFGFGAIATLIGLLTIIAPGHQNASPIIVLVLLGFACGHFFCGRSLWTLEPAGRIVGIIFAVLWLIAIPIGTVFGILTLVYLLQNDQRLLFSGKELTELNAAELSQLHTMSQSGSTAALATTVAVTVIMAVSIPITGIIAAIAIPNFLNAINRGRCKRTVADLQIISAQIDAYQRETGVYPQQVEDIYDLVNTLDLDSPIPTTDGWRREIAVEINLDDYRLISWGRDGEPGPDEPTGSYDTDIIIENGLLIQAPIGVATDYPSGHLSPPESEMD